MSPEYHPLEPTKDWTYKQRVLLHAIMEQLAVDMFANDDPDRYKSNEYDKFAVDVVRGYIDGKPQLQNAGNLMVADSSLEALLLAVNEHLGEMSIENDLATQHEKIASKGYLVMTCSVLMVEIPQLPDEIIDAWFGDLQWSKDSEHFHSDAMMSWVGEVRGKAFEAMKQILLHDPEQRKIYEDIKQRLGIPEDYEELMDEADCSHSHHEVISNTFSWPMEKRVLFHAVCGCLVENLLSEEPDLEDCNDYLGEVEQLLDDYMAYANPKKKVKAQIKNDEMLDAIKTADSLLLYAIDELSDAWEDFFIGDCGFDIKVQTFKAIFCTTALLDAFEKKSAREMLKSFVYDTELDRYTSELVSGMAGMTLQMVKAEYESTLGFEDEPTIDLAPLMQVYDRIFCGFEREPDEPDRIQTFLCPTVPYYYPKDPDAYYKRKMRETFKTIDKNRDLVKDDDCWSFICVMREWLHQSTLLRDEKEESMATAVVYNLLVEFVTGLSKGVMRERWESDDRFREIVSSLLDDAVSLFLLYMENEGDDYVVKVHRRFRRLQHNMSDIDFHPIDFERIFDYVNARLL